MARERFGRSSCPLLLWCLVFVHVVTVTVRCQHKCEPLTITKCMGLNYNETMFPNFENHRSQSQADEMIRILSPLFRVKCSPDLKYFVCSYYAPLCTKLGKLIPPCRSLCESARSNCLGIVKRFGYDWPHQLRCEKFPPDGSLCVGRNQSVDRPTTPTMSISDPVTITKKIQHKCEPLTIKKCMGLNYSETLFPNFENHRSQSQANEMIEQLSPLFNIKCSPDLKYLVCSYYAPLCTKLGKLIPPCRSLCESARSNCLRIVKKVGYDWPHQLRCEKFPLDGSRCVGSRGRNQSVDRPTTPTMSISDPVRITKKIQHKCEPLTIKKCMGLNYSETLFPNFENHRSQSQANEIIEQLSPLFRVKCSPDLKYFVCSYYAPLCTKLGILIPPCRSLCESARSNCLGIVQMFGYVWPHQLRCTKFPSDGSLCVGRNQSVDRPMTPPMQ